MSVYKVKRGNTVRWRVVIPKEAGSLKRTSVGMYPTKRDAEKAEASALTDRERGIDLVPGRVAVGEIVDRFVTDARARGAGAKTLQEYEGIVDRAIRPHLGSIPIGKLRPARIAAWHATLLEKGGARLTKVDGKPALRDGKRIVEFTGKPLSSRSVRHADALLRGALAWAVRMQLVALNAATAVKAPTARRSDVRALTGDEVQRVLSIAQAGRWGPFVAILLATAGRRGEILALNWSDVDLERGAVTISASMSQTKGGVSRKSTKTDRVRVVPLAPFAVAALQRRRDAQLAELTALAGGDELKARRRQKDTAVFTDEAGQRYRPMQANDAYRTIAAKAEVPTGLHTLRHTAITLLLVAGTDVRTAAGIAGHANPTITLSVYGHLVESAARSATDTLGATLERLARPT